MDVNFTDMLSDIMKEKKIQKQIAIKNELEKEEKIIKELQKGLDNPYDMPYSDYICNDCKSSNMKEIEGYYTCLNCGLRNDCIIDAGQEWRYYGNDDNKGGDPARCDIPTNELLPKISMGSIIGYGSRENYTTKKIRNMNNWYSMPYKESTLLEIFNNITIMAQNSGINQCIIEEAKYMYKKVSELKSSRRNKKEGMKAGSLFLACKLRGVPRNCNEIAKICHITNNKTLRKSIKTFEEIWNNIQLKEKNNSSTDDLIVIDRKNMKIIVEDNDIPEIPETPITPIIPEIPIIPITPITPITPTITPMEPIQQQQPQQLQQRQLENNEEDKDEDDDEEDDDNDAIEIKNNITKIHRITSKLGIDDKYFEICKIIFTYIEKNNYLDKHNPLSRISSIIYYVIEEYKIKISKYLLIQTCEISDVTITKCYQKLLKYKSEISNIL